jgi:hypothetical protein
MNTELEEKLNGIYLINEKEKKYKNCIKKELV